MKAVLLSIFSFCTTLTPTPNPLPSTPYPPSTINYQLSTTHYPLPCTGWKLHIENRNAKVFVRDCADSPIKEFKVTDTFFGNFEALAKVMQDIETTKNISDNCTEAKILKTLDPQNSIRYFYFKLPLLSDREVITKSTITIQPKRITCVSNVDESEQVPLKKDVIRLRQAYASFTFDKLDDGTISMEYIARTDPNGTIPAWFVNALAGREALKMLNKLKRLVNH